MPILQVTIIFSLMFLAVIIFKFPEFGLVLCVVCGSYIKGIIQPIIGTIDITVYLFIVTYFSIFLHRSIKEKKIFIPPLKINIWMSLFVMILLGSLLYTPLPKQGIEIFFRFIVLDVSMMYMVYIWAIDTDKIERILYIFSGISITYGLLLAIAIFFSNNNYFYNYRGAFISTAPIAVAINLAAGILITLLVKNLIKQKHIRGLLTLLAILSTVALITLNSRGPLIAFICGVFSIIFLIGKERKKYIFLFIKLVGALSIIFIFIPKEYTSRYSLITNLESSSISARLSAWRFVVDHFSEWFFKGAGLFGYAYYYPENTTYSIFGSYPHNIFLDVFADVGFFGLLFFLGIIGFIFYKGFKMCSVEDYKFRILGLSSFIAFIVFMINAFFSTSLINTRPIWFFGGLILSLGHIWRKDNIFSKEENIRTYID